MLLTGFPRWYAVRDDVFLEKISLAYFRTVRSYDVVSRKSSGQDLLCEAETGLATAESLCVPTAEYESTGKVGKKKINFARLRPKR